jgi:hypothetical protein
MLAYIMRISERPALKAWRGWSNVSIINNIYMIVVTMTTVGYGDFVPITTLGKMVTITTALWGGFIISLLIVSVNDIFALSEPQKVAYDNLVRVRAAVKCIVSAMRYQVIKQRFKNHADERASTISRITLAKEDVIEKVNSLLLV